MTLLLETMTVGIRIYKTILQLLSNNILLFVNDTGRVWGGMGGGSKQLFAHLSLLSVYRFHEMNTEDLWMK